MATEKENLSDFVERVEIRNGRIISLLHLLHVGNSEDVHHDLTVFIYHGSMATWKQFEELIHYFRGICNVVAYDAFGCGDSDKPVDSLFGNSHYSAEELIVDAIQVFGAYATQRNILIGHSFGSAIVARVITAVNQSFESSESETDSAETAVNSRPKIVASILLGTHFSSPLTRHPVFFLPVFILDSIQEMLSNQFAEIACSPSTSDEVKIKCKQLSQKNEMHVAKSFYSNFGWASTEDWKSVAQYPVLICQGKDDLITPVEGSLQLFHHIVKHAPDSSAKEGNDDKLKSGKTDNLFEVIPEAGHQLMQEQPEVLLDVISKFLREKCSLDF